MKYGTTKKIKVGNRMIGGGAPITIQSMLKTRSDDITGSVEQAKALEAAGCDILRLAIPDMEAVRLIPAIKKEVNIPLVADIHFDYRLALESVAAGIDKIRINPGNIGSFDRVQQVADACRSKNIPIRIGVNGGSLEKDILAEYGYAAPEAMVRSAQQHIELLERCDFTDIVVSLKASDVHRTVQAYRLMSSVCDYPLHLGVTEAGTPRVGMMKSALGIGALLMEGIGDTIRVSLTGNPVQEIYAAKDILNIVGKSEGPTLVSCPTCGRTRINMIELAQQVEYALRSCDKNITVAVMGCAVNGPGEAKEADIGIAGGDGCGLIFKKGEILRKVPEEELLSALLSEIELL